MATINATEARLRLYKKCEEELQPLFSEIELAVKERRSSLVYHNLDDLQRQYLSDTVMGCGFRVKESQGVKTGFNTDVVGRHWDIEW